MQASQLALLTDLYQLTMAQGYHRSGLHTHRAVFHLFFRKLPFKNGYAVAAGLEDALQYLAELHLSSDDLDYLRSLTGADHKPLFDAAFLQYLSTLRFTGDVAAIAEGRPVFAHEPLLRIEAPLIEAQLVETALLNILNFQTLIATKAARVVEAAGNDPVLEFGLRRAQGVDGALSASRAAFIGGVGATSNVLAGKRYGIPVRGTHAHAWVMAFDDELSAFDAYAKAMPNNCVFLVDTYDTLEGVKHAILVGKRLRSQGHDLLGIRLDSGDLAYLSIEARKLLDAAGFNSTRIVASNDLDEGLIASLKQQGAKIDTWGVGTKLITAYDQPALGGVYKLAAIRGPNDHAWKQKVKVSEQAIKTSNPGLLQVRRFRNSEQLVADCIYDLEHPPTAEVHIVDAEDATRQKTIAQSLVAEDLLSLVMNNGQRTLAPRPLAEIRSASLAERQLLHPSIRRQLNPHGYPAGLEQSLHERKVEMVRAHRSQS